MNVRLPMWTAAVVVVAAVLGAAPVASARHECRGGERPAGTGCATSDVWIRYRPQGDQFTGRVTSHMGYCKRNRVVLLQKKRPGDDVTLAKTRSNREGRYRFRDYEDVRGRFYAVARYKSRPFGMDGAQICYRARSRTIEV